MDKTTGSDARVVWLRLVAALCTVCLPTVPYAYQARESLLPPNGYHGIGVGCGINQWWLIGGFREAKNLREACEKLAKDHNEDEKRKPAKRLALKRTEGSLFSHPLCFFSMNGENDEHCGMIEQLGFDCPRGTESDYKQKVCLRSVQGYPACHATVKKLHDIQVVDDDPTAIFVRNQTCIAERACTYKAQLEDPRWLDKVLPEFVEPFLKKSREWPMVIRQCSEYKGVLRNSFCARDMAEYHIKVDLRNAVNLHSCGTDHDWERIADHIEQCLTEAGGFTNWVARQNIPFLPNVHKLRNQVRTNCLSR